MQDWRPATVTRRIDHSDALFTLELDAPDFPSFEAGQWSRLRIGETARAYSLASPPGAPPRFYIRVVPDGALTPALARLEPGDVVDIDYVVQGHFHLGNVPPARVLWLVGTGTGIGPYLSMLAQGELWRRYEQVVFVYGVREAEDLAYAELLDELADTHAFRWVACVSREDVTGHIHARITDALTASHLARTVGEPTVDDHVLLCGNPAMVKEFTSLLKERGLAKHRRRAPGQISVERYW